ncbi:MAG: hypothetical protein RL095_3180 [Verrucomicrobiota bacterium]|jgi:hypothetical protein
MIKRFAAPFLLSLSLISSACAADGTAPASSATVEFAPVLSAAKFETLFSGKAEEIEANFEQGTGKYPVEDGILVCKGGNLVTKKDYADFIFDFEFQLPAGGNNGVGIRAPFPTGDVAYTCMELQLLDDSAPQYAKLHDYQFHGSIYGVNPPVRGSLKPLGEWNHQTIIAQGSKITIIVNGKVVQDRIDLSTKVPQMNGKTQYAQGLHRPSGRICFAGHGDPVKFRNVKVAELPAAHALPTTHDNVAPAGFTALFDGKTLANWKGQLTEKNLDKPHARAKASPEVLAAAQAKADEDMLKHWSVVDGSLRFDGKGHSLASAKKYKNFELYVSWKIHANGDSGIYLRGSPQVQIWDPANPREVGNGAPKGSGGIWNNPKEGKFPLVKADKPVEEWNTFFIRCIGDKVSIWLNGQLIVSHAKHEYLWDKNFPFPAEEIFELQCHGNEVFFKNIYLRELP